MIFPESEAAWILREHGFGSDEAVPARRIAEAMMGPGCIRVMRLMGRPAHLARVHGEHRIYIRPGLSAPEQRFAILHECAEKHLSDLRYEEPDREQLANAIAAALVAPGGAYLAARRELGDRFDQLASAFQTTETCAALRLAETTGVPVAVIAPCHVRTHEGDCSWRWPDDRAIREAATGAVPWGTRHRLAGRRVALVADRAA